MNASEIRKEANYSGVRVILISLIDRARGQIQIDIGFGDAVYPDPEEADYPVMIKEFKAPKLQVYPRYTVVAEKLEALTTLGIANSRMKDFFDLRVLAQHAVFDGDTLRKAVRATFDRRKTTLTGETPFGLTEAFSQDAQKRIQWSAFLRKNRLEPQDLTEVVSIINRFLLPVIKAASTNTAFNGYWKASEEWLSSTQFKDTHNKDLPT